MWQIIIFTFLIWYLHLMSKYKSLLLTEPCAFVARHIYWPCVCFDMLCRTSDWFVMMTPRVGCNGLLLWYHSIFFIGGLASIRHSKYTSVPFAKFFGSRFEPNDNETIGASIKSMMWIDLISYFEMVKYLIDWNRQGACGYFFSFVS